MSTDTLTRNDVEEQIIMRDREFERNVAAKDAARLCLDLYTADAKLLAPNAPSIQGRANIEAFWRGLIEAGLCDVKLTTTEIMHFGNMAYATGTYRLAIESAGGESVQDQGKYVYIYRCQPDGSWKALLDIFNSDGPVA